VLRPSGGEKCGLAIRREHPSALPASNASKNRAAANLEVHATSEGEHVGTISCASLAGLL